MSPALSWLVTSAVLAAIMGPLAWWLLRSVSRTELEPLRLPGTVVEHNWRIVYGPDGYRWRCSCSDAGEWRAVRVQAERDAYWHETTAARTR